MPTLLELFYKNLKEIYLLRSIGSLLHWDQNVCMPRGGASARAEQAALVSRLVHERMTAPAFVDLVARLESEKLGENDAVNVREIQRDLKRLTKLPTELVAAQAEENATCFQVWTEARPKNDFAMVKPYLAKVIDTTRRIADLIGYAEHPYDALLDHYEPQATLKQIKPLLVGVGESLRSILPGIVEKCKSWKPCNGDFPEAVQAQLNQRVVEAMGYSFQSGRIDSAPHPFMTTIALADARITTRYLRENFHSALFTILHEAGHALYEQGINPAYEGTPLGETVSLGIHESQSRLWENLIGRSQHFAVYLHRLVKEFFPDYAASVDPDLIFKQMNRVTPSLIRVEADEVTYSLHVVIRMLLEEQIVSGRLEVDQLPEQWDALYDHYLGMKSLEVKDGVLQDVHWFKGFIGYFPTYLLGNIYGAMFMETAQRSLPGLSGQIENGEFLPLREWLRVNIHSQGRRYSPNELVRRVTGQEPSEGPFLDYIKKKFE